MFFFFSSDAYCISLFVSSFVAFVQLRRRKKRDLVKHTAVVKTAFRRTVGNLTGNGIKCANYRTGVKVSGKRFHVGSCLSYRSWMMSNSFPVALQNSSVFNIERNVTVACLNDHVLAFLKVPATNLLLFLLWSWF